MKFKTFITQLIRALVKFILFLLIIPLFLIPLYALINPPTTPLMLWHWNDGETINRSWRSLDNISINLQKAVVMAEDTRFCGHAGVDWSELKKVIDNWETLEASRGASTITMQMIKNLFLWQSKGMIRKGLEFVYATYAELFLDKKRILEIYLNIAQWGDNGLFGAEAAARHYFAISAAELSLEQSALLAVTLPLPRHRNPANPSSKLIILKNVVAIRMVNSAQWLSCIENRF